MTALPELVITLKKFNTSINWLVEATRKLSRSFAEVRRREAGERRKASRILREWGERNRRAR